MGAIEIPELAEGQQLSLTTNDRGVLTCRIGPPGGGGGFTAGGDLAGTSTSQQVVGLTGVPGVVGGTVNAHKTQLNWTEDNGADSGIYLMRVQPTEAAAPPFIVGTGAFTNPDGARLNQVWSAGWNMGAGGTAPIVAGEPAIGIGFESDFSQDASADDFMEYHIYFVTKLGVQRRPWSFTGNRDTGETRPGMHGDIVTIARDAGGNQTMLFNNTVSPKAISIGLGDPAVFRSETNDLWWLSQLNSLASAHVGLVRLNARDHVEIGEAATPIDFDGIVHPASGNMNAIQLIGSQERMILGDTSTAKRLDVQCRAAAAGVDGVFVTSDTITCQKSDTVTNTFVLNANGINCIDKIGFNGSLPHTKPTIVGSCGGIAPLKTLLTELANYGLVVDNTTP